ncbi:VOC family protein [Myxococcota bacterium]|nr:VOC family protein [Myxococcota bacterium]
MTRKLDETTLVRPSKFAHVVLRTRHFEEAIAWYGTVLGMEVVFRNDLVAFMTYDEEHHRLALFAVPDKEAPAPGSPGLDHMAYTFDSIGALLGQYRRLRAEGIEPAWTINHGPTTSLYYDDPDGNRVELQVDNFDSVAENKAWMESETFRINPIGVPFDPEELVARYESGEPWETLRLQPAEA